MKKPKRAKLLFAFCLTLCLLGACGDKDVQDTPAVFSVQTEIKNESRAEDEHSYPFDLGGAVFSARYLRAPRPFPVALRLSDSALALVYDDGGPSPYLIYPDKGAGLVLGGRLLYLDADIRARREGVEYSLVDSELVAIMENGETLWRYADRHKPSAGPLVFNDLVLIATDEPAFVAVGRLTGALAFRKNVDHPPLGPLTLLETPRLLAAYHSDGLIGLYGLTKDELEPLLDPVEAYIRPSQAALRLINAELAKLSGDAAFTGPERFELYGPRRSIPASGIGLFKYYPENDGTIRLYVHGAAEAPYLLALFDHEGAFLRSNVDYGSADKLLSFPAKADRFYYVATGRLVPPVDDDQSAGGAEAVLVASFQ